LPISDAANETSELYFWFFPSENPDADDEITIWLNGMIIPTYMINSL
jgi:carboxypeptidase D